MAERKQQAQSGSTERVFRRVVFEGKEYIPLRAAAKILGISHTTIYAWMQKGVAGNDLPLDVIENTLTGKHLISMKCVDKLLASRFRRSLATMAKEVEGEPSDEATLERSEVVRSRRSPA